MSADERRAYYRSLPAKRMGAGVIFRDSIGRVLLVDPVYKDRWEVPGGIVEEGESPHAAAVREVREELGIECGPMRMWCADWRPADDVATDAIMFLFDGGQLSEDQVDAIVLPPDELKGWAYCTLDEAKARIAPILHRRLSACLDHPHASLYLDAGVPMLGTQAKTSTEVPA